jgi:hypothetical protein
VNLTRSLKKCELYKESGVGDTELEMGKEEKETLK